MRPPAMLFVLALVLGCSGQAVDPPNDVRFEDIRAKQLEMTEATFARLQELGLTPESEVQLDFFFSAPSEESAKALRGFLETETDYNASVHYTKEPTEMWSVEGSTQSTSVTLDILKQWVDWMVSAGQQYDCEFDGWGTEI